MASARTPLHRTLAGALVLALTAATLMARAEPAAAAVSGATSTSTTGVVATVATALQGLSVAAGASDPVDVNVSTTSGTLSVDTSTGITLAYGYSSSGAELAFGGTGTQVNAALATITMNAAKSDRGSTATVAITARSQDGRVYSSRTEHFYEYVASSNITWTAANTAASGRTYRGQDGYLATVPNSRINDLITSKIPNAENVWLGGQATDNVDGYARVWSWVDGPLAGDVFTRCSSNAASVSCDYKDSGSFYHHWAYQEPNNYEGLETYLVTNWLSPNGEWNDLKNNEPGISGYVVEYGNLPIGTVEGFTDVYTASSTVSVHGAPDAPTGVSASATSTDRQIKVTFTAPANNGGATIDGYRVTLSPGGATVSCTASPCTISNLTAGQAYSVTVAAHNTYGYSPESGSASATPGATPGAPAGFPTALTVDSAATGTVTATAYPNATYSVTGGSLPAGVTLNTSTGAVGGTPTTVGDYSVQITATNSYGTAATTFNGTVSAVAPDAPTITEITPQDRSLEIAFTAPAYDGKADITGYRYSTDGGSTWSDVVTSTTSPLTVYGLENGTTYDVKLRAVNSVGDGLASATVQGTPASAPVVYEGSAPPEFPPGTGGGTEDGEPTTVTVKAEGDGWRVTSSSGMSLLLEAYGNDNELLAREGETATLVGMPDGYVKVEGSGFMPGTDADVWVFSTPIALGTLAVQPDGTFSGYLRIPASLELGNHTVQVNGTTAAGTTSSTSLGLRLIANRSALALTGAESAGLWWAAMLAIVAGAVLVSAAGWRSRRRAA